VFLVGELISVRIAYAVGFYSGGNRERDRIAHFFRKMAMYPLRGSLPPQSSLRGIDPALCGRLAEYVAHEGYLTPQEVP